MYINPSLIIYSIMVLLACASVWRPRSLGDLLKRLGFEKIRLARELPIAVGFLGLLFLVTMLVSAAAIATGMTGDLGKVTEAVRSVDIGDLLIVVVVASIVEEVFFRGFLQRKIGIWAATFIFAYFHIIYGSLFEVIGAFFLGLVLAKEYEITRNLFTPALSHVLYNMVAITLAFV